MNTSHEEKLQQQFSDLLSAHRFSEASTLLLSEVKPSQVTRFLHQVAEQEAGILVYTFVNEQLILSQSAFWHRVAACIISESMGHIKQGHKAGLYHILKAIELDPSDWLLKEYALSFYEEGVLEAPLAKQFAADVLKEEDFNKLALRILEKENS